MRFIVRLLITGFAVFAVAYLSNGTLLHVSGFLAAVVFALVLGLVNAVLKPIAQLLALPLTILTVGIAALLVNLGMFYIAAALTPGVAVVGFWPSVAASLIIAFFTSVAAWMTDRMGGR